MTTANLRIERVRRSTDNKKCDPLDVLLLAHEELSAGPAVRKLVLIVETEKPDGTSGLETFRAGVTRYEEIALLRLQEVSTIEKWRA